MTARVLTVVLSFLCVPLPSFAQFASDQQRREAWRHYRVGQELMAAEQFAKAAEAFGRAIEQDRLLALAHYGQGQALMALRRFSSAVRAFTACGDALQALHDLGDSHRQTAERRRQEELRELREIARRVTDGRAAAIDARMAELERRRSAAGGAFAPPAFLSLALGSAHFRTGDLVEAERHWKAAVAADPRFGEAHNNLAALYAMTNRRRDAEEAVRAAEESGFRVNPQLKVDIAGL